MVAKDHQIASELSGLFTKYGDGGVDLSPIADLSKTEVYALGRALEVNPAILTAAPADGLWGDDRTDEDQIGASYPDLEWAHARRQAPIMVPSPTNGSSYPGNFG